VFDVLLKKPQPVSAEKEKKINAWIDIQVEYHFVFISSVMNVLDRHGM
jgi:hypothetical protein